jgi:hypothetical protein
MRDKAASSHAHLPMYVRGLRPDGPAMATWQQFTIPVLPRFEIV